MIQTVIRILKNNPARWNVATQVSSSPVAVDALSNSLYFDYMMNSENTEKLNNDTQLYNDKSYVRNKYIILTVSILFLMIRFGAIIPDFDKLSIKGFKIISLSKTIIGLYLVWLYLCFSFYQKYWSIVKKDIIKYKKKIFKKNIAPKVLRKVHEKHGHDFDWYEIYSLSFRPIMHFGISYSPISFQDHGEEKHERRHLVIDLKLKQNRNLIFPYLVEVYFRGPIVTEYIIPFSFPVLAWIICMIGDWPGSLRTIFAEFLN